MSGKRTKDRWKKKKASAARLRSLDKGSTCWVLVSDSVEPRHLADIVWAVDSLRKGGWPDADVLVYTADPIVANVILAPYGVTPRDLSTISSDLGALRSYKHAVVTVGGHGTELGIKTLTPTALLSAVRSIPALEVGVVVLCQCYGGVFNLIDAKVAPPLVVIGATNLDVSLSTRIQLAQPIKQSDGTDGARQWLANLFQFNFFEWLRAPKDIDGDGLVNLMDAYKYAGILSNAKMAKIKGSIFLDVNRLIDNAKSLLLKAQVEAASPQQKLALQLQAAAASTAFSQTLDQLYVHQEPWILHADLARLMCLT